MKGIITSDWHLRDDKPICRLDKDWYDTQKKCIDYVIDIANERDCGLNIVGDLFHRPIVSPKIVNLFLNSINKLNNCCFILVGNHDIQYGNMENINNSSIGIVLNSRMDQICKLVNIDGEFLFLHELVFESVNQIPPNCDGITAKELLKKYQQKKYIFTGDNHKSFSYNDGDRYVLNPGCLIRQNANEIDYHPNIFYFEDGEIETIDSLDNKFDCYITRNHLEKMEKRDERIQSFIDSIRDKKKLTLNFEDNLKKILETSPINNRTKEIIEELFLECN